MSTSISIIFGAIIFGLAFLIARNARANGYHFWRTLIMSILGFTGILFLILKLLN